MWLEETGSEGEGRKREDEFETSYEFKRCALLLLLCFLPSNSNLVEADRTCLVEKDSEQQPELKSASRRVREAFLRRKSRVETSKLRGSSSIIGPSLPLGRLLLREVQAAFSLRSLLTYISGVRVFSKPSASPEKPSRPQIEPPSLPSPFSHSTSTFCSAPLLLSSPFLSCPINTSSPSTTSLNSNNSSTIRSPTSSLSTTKLKQNASRDSEVKVTSFSPLFCL